MNVVLRAVVLALGAALLGAVFNQVRPALHPGEDGAFAGGIEIGRSVLEQKAAVVERERERVRAEPASRPERGAEPPGSSVGDVTPSPASGTGDGEPPSAQVDLGDLPFRLSLAETRAVHEGDGMFLDARPLLYYEQGHIPGARLLPPDRYDELIYDLMGELPVDRPIVVYCDGGDCSSSLQVAQRLTMEGYPNIHVFEGGFPEWRSRGLPVQEGAAP